MMRPVLVTAAGIGAFWLWIETVGPSLHVVETVIGVALAAAAAGAVLAVTRARRPPGG
jgi:hypothetical protein